MTPDDTPRGGAEPRVSEIERRAIAAEDLVEHMENAYAQLSISVGKYIKVVADLRAKLAETESERDESWLGEEALRQKIDALSAHETCGCSYDAPDHVCAHHSPQLIAAYERADQAEAALRRVTEERDAAQEQRSFWYNGAKELGERLDIANARATAAEATVASLKREVAALREGLAPFARHIFTPEPDNSEWVEHRYGDFRRAAHLLDPERKPVDGR